MSTPMAAQLGGHDLQVDDTDRRWWERASTGQWEPSTVRALTSSLGPGDLFLDIGAWVGPTSMLAVSCGARVIAFEPDPAARARLVANLTLNGMTDAVEVRGVALFHQAGSMQMVSLKGGGGDSTATLIQPERDGEHIDVETVDVRDVVTSPEFRGARLVKIDVEGAEYALVERLAPVLPAQPPDLLLSLHGMHYREQWLNLPLFVRRPLQRVASTTARARLLLRLRRYRRVYVSVGGGWRRASLVDMLRLLGSLGETEVVLATGERSL